SDGGGQIRCRRGCGAAQECLARLPFARRIQVFEQLHFTRGKEGDRYPIPIEQPIAGESRKLWSGGKDANKVQRIGAADRYPFAGVRPAPQLTQHRNCIRQGKLLAGKATNEPAAANFSSTFQRAIDAQQVAPGRQPCRLTLQQSPEDDPVAAKQGTRDGLGCLRPNAGLALLCTPPVLQRPASGLLEGGVCP